ncbi:MAG: T9SS type A sorting domain-containing protein, partial [Ignavibacterium sp.]
NLQPGKYLYRLKQIDFDGSYKYSDEVEVEIISPNKFVLEQNYPNPFNPGTTISWQSPVSSRQTIKLFNTLGEEVDTIVDEYLEAGEHSKFYIINSSLPSGIYLYQLKVDDLTLTKKMVYLK